MLRSAMPGRSAADFKASDKARFEFRNLIRASPVMIGTALFALGWLIVRAKIQSITIDEANTCWWTVFPDSPAYWLPAANNHVLNSILIKLSIAVFGLSEFSVRLPTLLGACLYISACLYITRLLSRRLLQQWPLFVCLVFDPYIADYLVAARGYGLALAFLAGMMALLAMLYFRPHHAGGAACLSCVRIRRAVFLGQFYLRFCRRIYSACDCCGGRPQRSIGH